MENIRLLLIIALSFIGLMLWEAWQEDYGTPPAASAPAAETPQAVDVPPAAPKPESEPAMPGPPPAERAEPTQAAPPIHVQTDVLSLLVSPTGGTIEHAALLAYPVSTDAPGVPVVLLDRTTSRTFIYQGGITGNGAQYTHRAVFTSAADRYALPAGADELVVPLEWRSDDGTVIEKRLRLKRGSYLIEVEYAIRNQSGQPLQLRLYEQLMRNEESSRQGMVYTFTGAALSTPEKRFEKFDLDDLKDAPIDISASDAWTGIIQHYFVAALLPPPDTPHHFYSKVLDDEHYLVGFYGPAVEVPPGAATELRTSTYIGPKRHDILEGIAPGLELSVDYGVLWFIAKPLFVGMRFLYELTGNWGWAIVIVTLLLKLVFYPLSAAGYRSMANMRKIQPRMLALRDRYADDRAQLNQAMMKLYKDEKINPLGGCLPILIQIPVFIALYWVLLESVEMRQAPFILWIKDLSVKDPYFVLPLLMGVSMWGQQKLNPAPLDPTQAKVMQVLPIVFTVFFAFFPSGLVLYWLVNNILSIAQQWQITRAIEQADSS
jgi:YidC/Oxa1 family membrane protein insertase